MSEWNEWAEKIKRAHEALEGSDYYKILSVPSNADEDTIRKAYYMRARQLHPDRVRSFPEPTRSQAVAIFKRVAEAYQTLTDPELRKAYDAVIAKGKKRLVVSNRLALKPKGELDFLSTDSGKQYYKAARDALKSGNASVARLSIRLAIQYEGRKKELLELEAKINRM